MKKGLIIGLAVLMVLGLSGLALADSGIILEQVGSSTADIVQVNSLLMDIYQEGTLNDVKALQTNGGTIIVDQIAVGCNDLYINADRDYNVTVEQIAGGNNYLDILGDGSCNFWLYQNAAEDNTGYFWIASASWGINIAGASSTGSLGGTVYDPGIPATQIAHNGSNEFRFKNHRGKGANTVGLYQEAKGSNTFDLDMDDSHNNTFVVYQINTDGDNLVSGYQEGGMTATVYQSTSSGDGVITINQS